VIADYLGEIPPKHGACVTMHKTGQKYYVFGREDAPMKVYQRPDGRLHFRGLQAKSVKIPKYEDLP
jgi:hypothetical protein